MQNWANGYIRNIDYTYGFYRNLTPSNMAFIRQCQQVNGPDLANMSTYCELGCGQGVSANLLAASNPHIDFYANDFNPAHISQAQELAHHARLPNIRFFEDDFEKFTTRSDLPEQFDIIALHGVYSWVGDKARTQIREFLRQKLKPSGLIYISYNAMPGWAPLLPLRHLLTSLVQGEPTPEKLQKAIDQIKQILKTKPAYAAQVPGLMTVMQKLEQRDFNYVVHEYFNEDCTAFAFSQVAKELSEAKAVFVKSMDALDHFDDLHFSDEQRQILHECTKRPARQDMRDFLINEKFRRDLFIKGERKQSSYEIRQGWLKQNFARLKRDDGQPIIIKTAKGQMDLDHPIHQQILDCLREGPASFEDILSALEPHHYKWSVLIKALTLLVGAQVIQPCPPQSGLKARKTRTDRLNHQICQQALSSSDLHHLASPVLGSAVAINRYSMIFLLAEAKGQRDPALWAYQQLEWSEASMASVSPAQMKEGPKLERLREMYDYYDQQLRTHYQQLGLVLKPDHQAQGLAEKCNGKDEGSEYCPSHADLRRFSNS